MASDLIGVLTRFHRDVVLPDIRETVNTAVTALSGEVLSHFDELYRRLDRLEVEYHALTAAVRRLEERTAAIEQKMDRFTLKSELDELKARVAELQQRIDDLGRALWRSGGLQSAGGLKAAATPSASSWVTSGMPSSVATARHSC